MLDPANALHGDIGLLDDGGVVLALSYSGEYEELINLIGVNAEREPGGPIDSQDLPKLKLA